MKFTSPFTILFVLLILQQTIISSMADEEFIEDTCKRKLNYNLCMTILSNDPKSKDGNLTDLSLIGVDAVRNKGLVILGWIENLKNDNPGLIKELDDCKRMYNIVVNNDVPSAIEALKGGQPKPAEDGISDVVVQSDACEHTFGESGHASLLTDLNKAMSDIANTVKQIIHQFL